MMMLCEELQERLNSAWYNLQQAILGGLRSSISQYELDDRSVEMIEEMVDKLEKQVARAKAQKVLRNARRRARL